MPLRSTTGVMVWMLLCVAEASPMENLWHVNPSECVVKAKEEHCDTWVSVSLVATELNNPCVYVKEQPKGCFSHEQSQIQFPIMIDADLHLRLVDAQQNTLASFNIHYRVMRDHPQRRRVRLPWSVF